MRTTVVGAGASGLTCALRLAEAGHAVHVLAARLPGRTTSDVAAALWYPYRALPQDAVTRWSGRTREVLTALARDPATGVRLRAGRELLREASPDPWWRPAVPDLARLSADRLPPGYRDGWTMTVPVVEPAVHLAWLQDRLQELGVAVEQRELRRLEEAPGDVVVHSTGLGAGPLVGDDSLVPVRGQVVVVEQVGVQEWLLAQGEDDRPLYVVPRSTSVVLGGTADVGATGEEPDPAVAADVLERCTTLVPELSGARVLAHRVGLRPTRPAVRLEAGVLADGRRVVHDYGHGGAGWTLSYGCAEDVVALVAGRSLASARC